jgi:hypothetical protein
MHEILTHMDFIKYQWNIYGLYTNNFGGTKLKRNYIWRGMLPKEAEYHGARGLHSCVTTVPSRSIAGNIVGDQERHQILPSLISYEWKVP